MIRETWGGWKEKRTDELLFLQKHIVENKIIKKKKTTMFVATQLGFLERVFCLISQGSTFQSVPITVIDSVCLSLPMFPFSQVLFIFVL